MRRPGSKSSFLLTVCIGLCTPISPAASEEAECARPELEWNRWLADAEQRNPGLIHEELSGPERDELLRAYGCLEAGGTCPPDHVMALYCTGNAKVLLAFVKRGCVTMAEDVAIEDFVSFVRGGLPC